MPNTVIYEVREYVLDANGETKEYIPATRFRVLSATGPLAIAFGPTDGFQRIESGLGISTIEPFNMVRIKDISGAQNTILVAYAGSDVADSRLTVTGGQLGVLDPVGGESFSDIVTALQAVTAAMREATLLRAPLTTLDGATYAAANNTTTEVVSAAANTDGVIVRLAGLSAASNAAYVTAGGNYLLNQYSNEPGKKMIENVFVPAGNAISISSAGAGSQTTFIWYEVL
ncbi:hypothetical protein [Hwanghaeella sp. LZ110]|uniref:hypothetical protein n=1 Tax=Hwanghaeella sp. LZ110 TaxID=3402810 RepID=UPI003B672284